MKTIFTALLLVLMSISGLAHAGEAEIKKALASMLSPDAPISSIRKMQGLPLYEVVIGTDVVYTDDKGAHLIVGNIIDTKSKRNLTEERKTKLAKIKFSDLPLSMAIKQVRGNGKRVFATFEDPNCGYCKKLAKEMNGLTDVTIYTFLLPVLGPDSMEKAKSIWCSADRAKAWNDYMLNNTAPSAAGTCDTPIEKVMALANKLGIRGTPNIFLANGNRLPGFVPLPQLEKALNAASK